LATISREYTSIAVQFGQSTRYGTLAKVGQGGKGNALDRVDMNFGQWPPKNTHTFNSQAIAKH
jgi:hypothetical protein